MELGLGGKVALVTGASRGIGAAIAAALADEGAYLAVNYLTGKFQADEVAQRIRHRGGRAIALQADVTRPEQVEALVQAVLGEFGQLDILVNNAGLTTHTVSLDQFTPEDLQKCIAVNVAGILTCTKAAATHMKQRRYGKIVNIVSYRAYATRVPSPYDVSKAAALALTIETARELAPYNINIVSVSPGSAATEMNLEKRNTPEKRRAFEQQIPLGRIAQPEEIADLVCFLASDRARHITGTDLLITGGELFRW